MVLRRVGWAVLPKVPGMALRSSLATRAFALAGGPFIPSLSSLELLAGHRGSFAGCPFAVGLWKWVNSELGNGDCAGLGCFFSSCTLHVSLGLSLYLGGDQGCQAVSQISGKGLFSSSA